MTTTKTKHVRTDAALLRTAVTILRVYMKRTTKCQPELNRRTVNWLKRNELVR